MERSSHPLHGLAHIPGDGWQVWSHVLRYGVRCQCAKDAKRIAQALEGQFPSGANVDYTSVDAAIEKENEILKLGDYNHASRTETDP